MFKKQFFPKQGRIKLNTVGFIFHLSGCLTISLFSNYAFISECWVMFGLREKNIISKLLPVYALYFFPFIECFLPSCFEWANHHTSKMSFQPEHGCWNLSYHHGGGHTLIFTSKPPVDFCLQINMLIFTSFVHKQSLSMWCGLQSVPAPGLGSFVRSLQRDLFSAQVCI